MNKIEKKKLLENKMEKELDHYREWLISLSPEEILEHSFSFSTREDILISFENMELSEKQIDALLLSESPLNDIYDEYCESECDYMDYICKSIESCADYLIQMTREKNEESR